MSGLSPTVKARLLSSNRTQSGVVTVLLTGHNTLGRHLNLMVLSCSPFCRRCGAEEENSIHVSCEYEALASLRHVYLGSFFLDPEDVKSLTLGTIWNFRAGTRFLWLCIRLWDTKDLSKGQGASGPRWFEPNYCS
jgi:hypothetical protein